MALVEAACLVGRRWLRHKATSTSKELLPLIVYSLSIYFCIWRRSWVRHVIVDVLHVALSKLALTVHDFEIPSPILLGLHSHVQVMASHSIFLCAGSIWLVD